MVSPYGPARTCILFSAVSVVSTRDVLSAGLSYCAGSAAGEQPRTGFVGDKTKTLAADGAGAAPDSTPMHVLRYRIVNVNVPKLM